MVVVADILASFRTSVVAALPLIRRECSGLVHGVNVPLVRRVTARACRRTCVRSARHFGDGAYSCYGDILLKAIRTIPKTFVSRSEGFLKQARSRQMNRGICSRHDDDFEVTVYAA